MKKDISAADGIYWISRKPTNGKMHHFTVENSKSVWQTDGWHTVGKITDNFRRLIRVKFPPVKADEVKITVTDTLGVNYAKIYEVRIYE